MVVHSIVSAHALFLREGIEGGTTLPRDRLVAIENALAMILAVLLGHEPGPGTCRDAWPQTGTVPSPLRRWIRGHQLFAALSQSLIIALDRLAD